MPLTASVMCKKRESMKDILKSYLRNQMEKREFSEAISRVENLENSIGRTLYLKLKHGDKKSALKYFQSLNDCSVCGPVFTDDLAHSKRIRELIDSLESSGEIERTDKPEWYVGYLSNRNPYGAQGFYVCVKCGSIIDVCEPERMYRGCAEVVG